MVNLGIFILVWWCCQHATSALVYAAFPNRIPIGALLDVERHQAKTACTYKFDKHNNSTESIFKLDHYEKEINVSDSYQVNKELCTIMSRGVFAVVGFANTSSFATIQSYANNFHMPFISPSALTNITVINSHKGDGYVLRMRPLYDMAMVDVIRYYRWEKIFYLYDSNLGFDRVQHIFDILNNLELEVELDVIRIDNPNDCYTQLRNVDSRDPKESKYQDLDSVEAQKSVLKQLQDGETRDLNRDKYIILDFDSVEAQKAVLRQIQNLGMHRATYHYLLGGLTMDELELDEFIHGGVNITGFRLLDRKSPGIQKIQSEWAKLSRANPSYWKGAGMDEKIWLDSALTMDAMSVVFHGLSKMVANNSDVFRMIFRRGHVFNGENRGIPCTSPPIPWTIGKDIMNSLKNVSFPGITGHVSFDDHGYRKNYTLDVMELGLNLAAEKIGTWEPETGLDINRTPKPIDTDQKPLNSTRIVTTLATDPYIMLKKPGEDGKPPVGNDRFEGYAADLTEKVAEIVGFDYILKLVDDGNYGDVKDGQWNGMVGELTNRKVDMAIAPLTINSQRERVIDFSKPFMNLGISIMIKKPEKQKPGVFSFMDPLDSEIWMWIVLSYLGVSVVLFLVSRFSPYEWQIEDSVNGPTFTNDFTILNSLWFSLGAFMQQGCDISPRSMSGRVVGSAWWFFTLIIISSYTANLAAFLTVERMLTPIESADDLAAQTEIQYGTLKSGSTRTFFTTSKVEVYLRMSKYMKIHETLNVEKTKYGVEKVRESKGKYAFLLESTMNDFHNQKKPCNTMKVGGNLDSKGYGIATPLHSELREDINLAVLRLRESGTLQKLQKKWWYDKGECNAEAEGKGSTQSALTLSNVAGIFYILIAGLGLAMIMSLVEFIYKSKVEQQRQQKYAASFRSKTRLSVRGTPERENGGVGSPDMPKSLSTVPIARSSAVSLV